MSHGKPKHRRHGRSTAYNLIDSLMASPVDPMPAKNSLYQIEKMWRGLASIRTGTSPTIDDWRVCADAANLMESLVMLGHAIDADGLVKDAVTALALAGKRSRTGHAIRLDGPGITAVQAVLQDYASALQQLPARTIIQAHRATEHRILAIQRGQTQAHDVEVIAL
jgi:uncharacterized protein YyaL (SSP411 family)